jgi:hypothetical protein
MGFVVGSAWIECVASKNPFSGDKPCYVLYMLSTCSTFTTFAHGAFDWRPGQIHDPRQEMLTSTNDTVQVFYIHTSNTSTFLLPFWVPHFSLKTAYHTFCTHDGKSWKFFVKTGPCLFGIRLLQAKHFLRSINPGKFYFVILPS